MFDAEGYDLCRDAIDMDDVSALARCVSLLGGTLPYRCDRRYPLIRYACWVRMWKCVEWLLPLSTDDDLCRRVPDCTDNTLLQLAVYESCPTRVFSELARRMRPLIRRRNEFGSCVLREVVAKNLRDKANVLFIYGARNDWHGSSPPWLVDMDARHRRTRYTSLLVYKLGARRLGRDMSKMVAQTILATRFDFE